MPIKTFFYGLFATVMVALPALSVARSFRPNWFAVALVLILIATICALVWTKGNLSSRWRRAILAGAILVGSVSVFVVIASELLPPPTYENANYIVDPTDPRYWVRNAVTAAVLPDGLVGVACFRIVDAITGQRNRGDLSFVATALLAFFFGLYCTFKVACVSTFLFFITLFIPYPQGLRRYQAN